MTSPIREVNIEKILEDHLPTEVEAIDEHIEKLNKEILELVTRKNKLLRIAEAADISLL